MDVKKKKNFRKSVLGGQPADQCGYLNKRSNGRVAKRWQKRYFQVRL